MATVVSTAVARWGNSPAIRIPKTIMQEANLQEGDAVDFEVKAPGIIVVRITQTEPTLKDLVARINPQNRHNETDWGKPEGDEIF